MRRILLPVGGFPSGQCFVYCYLLVVVIMERMCVCVRESFACDDPPVTTFTCATP